MGNPKYGVRVPLVAMLVALVRRDNLCYTLDVVVATGSWLRTPLLMRLLRSTRVVRIDWRLLCVYGILRLIQLAGGGGSP